MPRYPGWCLLILLLLASPTAALACSFYELSEEERFAAASAVFLARVVRTEEVEDLTPVSSQPLPIVVGSLRVIEIFKGQPPTDGKVRTLKDKDGASCAYPLQAAHDYLFFLHEDGFAWGPSGTTMLRPGGIDRGLLEKLRKLARDAR